MTICTHPECAKGVRWDDQVSGVEWPIDEMILSDKDRAYKDFIPSFLVGVLI